MSNHGFGPELRFGQRPPRGSLYADDVPDETDHVSLLFNEAVDEIARRSWRDAEHTLVRLLELAPDDGEALVLLAKVHVARGRLEYALRALDDALEVGWPVDPQLRRAIADRLHLSGPPLSLVPPEPEPGLDATPSAPSPGVKDAVAARQRSFVLRQDNQDLHDKVASLEREVRRWIFATMGVCVTATALVTWALVPPPPPSVDASPTLATVMTPVRRVIRTPRDTSQLERAADEVVPHISNTLSVDLVDGVAVASGTLADYREREAIERAWSALDDVDDVDWSKVAVTSRLEGGRLQVRPGDTLSGIAFRYYGDASEVGPIERANRITAGDLRPDQFLMIPPLPRDQ